MHELLLQQIRQTLGDPNALPAQWQTLLQAISDRYDQYETQIRNLQPSPDPTACLLSDQDRPLNSQVQNAVMFQMAVEYSTEAISIIGEQGTMMYVNPAWEKLTGYTKAESLGKTIDMLRSGKTLLGVDEDFKRALQQREAFHSEEIIHRRKSGEEFNVSLMAYPMHGEANIPLVVVVQQDITERKIADASKSEFVSLASHQLRTPLTSIIWNLELLLGSDVAMMSKDQLDTLLQGAHKSSKRMAETIDTLMQLSNLEVGKIQPNFTHVELANLLEVIRTEQLPEYLKKQLTVSIQCPRELTAYTDPVILKEVLSNLLNNAIKYTPLKGNIVFAAEKTSDNTVIRVQDSGYGIPKEQQEKVFSKFFRGRNVLYIENTGNGLGLYLVHQLTRLVRADIRFESEENKGTTFIITLPANPYNAAPVQMQEFMSATPALPNDQPVHE